MIKKSLTLVCMLNLPSNGHHLLTLALQGYQFAPSLRFQPGEVFKVLWADPKGDGVVQTTDYTQLKNAYGELFYVSIRRFVIIATDEGNSTCV